MWKCKENNCWLLLFLAFGLATAFKFSADEAERLSEKEKSCLVSCTKIGTSVQDKLLLMEAQSVCVFQCLTLPASPINIKDESQNFCLNGNDPSKMTNKEILVEFAKGPCSPIILLAGFLGTKMMLEIDCETFKKENSEIFTFCGWTDCSKTKYEFWKSVPNTEYQIWIPEIWSNFSIFSFKEKSNMCYAKLIGTQFDFSKPVKEMVVQSPGLKMTPHGFTPLTKEGSKCGASSGVDLLPLYYQTRDTANFSQVFKTLEYIGYVSGLTYQFVPYNYLLSYRNNQIEKNFKNILIRSRKLTGKRAILFSHSFGNLNVLYQLSHLTLKEKRNLVFNWISISAPFSGAYMDNKTILSGNDELMFLHHRFGLHFSAAITMAGSHLAAYDLSLTDSFEIYSKEKWFSSITKRLAYEDQFPRIPYAESGILFWPGLDERCHEQQLHQIREACFTGIYNITDTPTFTVETKTYYPNDYEELYTTYGITSNITTLYKKVKSDELATVIPEVPVILIYGASLPTPAYFKYAAGFKDYVKANDFPKVDSTAFVSGDETVPAVSSLLTALRWAMMYENKENDGKDHQPVKFVEYCSTARRNRSIYDIKTTTEPFKITKNDYIGLQCECNDKEMTHFEACHHSMNHNDNFVINLTVDILMANQLVSPEDLIIIQQLDEKVLDEELKTCSYFDPTEMRSSDFENAREKSFVQATQL